MTRPAGAEPAEEAAAPEDPHELRRLAEKALARWDLDHAGISPIKIRENAVFRVDLRDGGRVALRVHRAGYHSDAALQSEFEWMAALHQAGIEVPRAMPSRAGRLFERIEARGAADGRLVDVLEWVEGRQLGALESGLGVGEGAVARCYVTLGEIAARMHNQSSAWRPPAGFVRHHWCEQGLTGPAPLWGRFWELEQLSQPQRTLLAAARRAIRRDLLAYGKSSRNFGLIHADLVPENLMVEGDRVRVIDFDDAGYGWHLFDLATSLYFLRDKADFDAALDAFLDGYRRHRPLPQSELAHLPLFLAARGTTYLGWVHEKKETETARTLTPVLIASACAAAEAYLKGRG
ncbi:MAG: phosphotransferase [Cupriavidus sp.]|nr:phosphotransferase [Cupriavidus sp.]